MNKLIQRAQEGDTKAFEELVRKYDRQVFSLAFQISRNYQDAEDIYQEVFIKVFKNIGSFNFKSTFFTWLYRITVNCALSFYKKRKNKNHISLEERGDNFLKETADISSTPEKTALDNELKEKIRESVDLLPQKQRTAFILRFYHQLKIKEIAMVTGCAEGTIKNYLFRAAGKMKVSLSSYIENEVN